MRSLEIPKIIWQTHEWDYKDLPQNFLAVTMTWKNLNPDWDYRYVSAAERSEYVKSIDQILYRMYTLSDSTSQADIWRYLVTYENGGVYADMDSICTAPLTYMLEQNQNDKELVCTELDENGLVNNANFAAVKSSKVIKKVLDNVMSYFKTVDYAGLLLECDSKEEFWERLTVDIKLAPDVYYEAVLADHTESVSFKFTAAEHNSELKTNFKHDYSVDFCGKKRSYYDLAREHGWETYIL